MLCAWAAFASTLPSAIWRVAMIIGFVPGGDELRAFELADNPALGYAYVLGLSLVQVGVGYLSLGLIRPWGVHLGSWRIPTALPVALATLGGASLIAIFDVGMVSAICSGKRPDAGLMTGWPLVIMVWCYLPILWWGPLVIVTAWGYAWCRRDDPDRKLHRAESQLPET